MYGTPQDVKLLTGITPRAFGFEDVEGGDTAAEQLDALLQVWLDRISSAIDARLASGQVSVDAPEYPALVDVAVRTVAKTVGIARQLRTAPIIQIEDFAIDILNTSQVTADLDRELRAFRTVRIDIFSTADIWEEPSG